MFTVIYEKENGKVVNVIGGKSNEENLRNALPITRDFIFVDSLPDVTLYRQVMKVKNNALVVEDLFLSEKEEKCIQQMEITQEINTLNNEMTSNDWKQLRVYRHLMLDGKITDEDKGILQWFNEKAIELENLRNKLQNI